MNEGSLLALAIGGWLLAGFTAVGAKVLRDFSRHEAEEYARRRRLSTLYDRILDRHEEVSLSVESLQLISLSIAVLAGFVWLIDPQDFSVVQATIAALCGTVLFLAGCVWMPWAVVGYWSAPFLFNTWRLWLVIHWLMWPWSLGATMAAATLRRLTGRSIDRATEEEAFEEEIKAIVTEGLRDGHLEADAGEMIEGVIELGDADVADIMTPRSMVDALDVNQSWPDAIQFIITCGRTRIPVYDDSLDHIVGVLYTKDLLPVLARDGQPPAQSLRKLLRRAWFVPQTKRVNELLRDFQRTHNHLAIVVDEYDAVAGVVTIEDALEEIVGEIVDEYDVEEELPIRPLDEHSAEVLGHAHVDEINETLGIDLPEDEEFDTINGFVLTRLGRLPRRDENFQFGPIRITVLDVGRRKIERLKVEVLGNGNYEMR